MTDFILFSALLQYLFGPLILLTSVLLILVVLVQRGRGGGLTGALGGPGGQSAFGTKAGDTFTKITVVLAVFWIVLCIAATKGLQDQGTNKIVSGESGTSAAPVNSLPGSDGLPSLTLPSEDSDNLEPPIDSEPTPDPQPESDSDSEPVDPS